MLASSGFTDQLSMCSLSRKKSLTVQLQT